MNETVKIRLSVTQDLTRIKELAKIKISNNKIFEQILKNFKPVDFINILIIYEPITM